MKLHTALQEHLEADTSVQSLMSSNFFINIIPQKVPSGASRIPCVVFNRRGVTRQVTYCGTSGLIETSFTLDVFGVTYTSARELAEAVKASLMDFSGLLGDGLSVKTLNLINEFDLEDMDPGLHRVSMTWIAWHTKET